jgi:hypothetical protein
MKKISMVLILIGSILGGAYYFVIKDKEDIREEIMSMTYYDSEILGLSFDYPTTYFIQEKDESTSERNMYSVVLAEDTEENRRVFSGLEPGREGPPTISITIFQNNLDNYTAREWIESSSFSNYKLSNGILTETVIDDMVAFSYQATGLYENDNVVVAHEDFVYMFTVFYLTPADGIRSDFEEMLRTVRVTVPSNERTHDLIMLDSPKAGSTIKSPLILHGQARGHWYFEATFPITLLDATGKIIAQHYAEAEQDWMTTDFVPYSGSLTYDSPPEGTKGTLILHRSNASDLPEYDDEYHIPVMF